MELSESVICNKSLAELVTYVWHNVLFEGQYEMMQMSDVAL